MAPGWNREDLPGIVKQRWEALREMRAGILAAALLILRQKDDVSERKAALLRLPGGNG
jgi:hypothetical protein